MSILKIFSKLTADDVMEKQLHDAKIREAQHRAAAEEHQAAAAMYSARVYRITAKLNLGISPPQEEPF